MPLSAIQVSILQTVAANRSPESYLAGATVFHRSEGSPRFSQDIDLFHDVADSVARSAELDAATLRGAGYVVQWLLQTPTFYRAVVSSGAETMKMEWAQDTAFRFFPVQQDPACGYCLHVTDAAVNKLLALAGRAEVRDFVDILHLQATHLSIGALAWAACGKDPGYTPQFLLEHAGRHACYTQEQVNRLNLLAPLDVRVLKRAWMAAVEEARRLVDALPGHELGCLYLSQGQVAVTPDPASPDFATLRRHFGSVRGAWPTISSYHDGV